MKKIFRNLMAIAIAGMTFTACEDVPAPYDVFDEGTVIEAAGSGTVADPFNVKAAIAKCKEIGTTESTEKYYIKGIAATMATADGTYGNATFNIVDVEGGDAFKCYQVAGTNGQKLPAGFTINKGDEVVVYGPIYNYNGKTPETAGKGAAYIVSVNGKSTDDSSETPSEVNAKSVTIAEFNAAAESSEWYQLTGIVKNLKDGDKFGNFDLQDETGSVYVYGLLSEQGGAKQQFQELAAEKGIKNGSKLTIIGNRGSYNDKIEVVNAFFVKVEEDGGEQPAGEAKGTGSEADPFNVAAAIAKCQAIGQTASSEKYYVTGIAQGAATADATYGNVTFDIADSEGGAKFKCYQVAGSNGEKLPAGFSINKGDEVVVYGPIYNYNGKTPETAGKSAAYIVTVNGKATNEGGDTPPAGEAKGSGTQADPWNVVAAINAINSGTLPDEAFVKGIIVQLDKFNSTYGSITYWISDSKDGSTKLQVYSGLNLNKEQFTALEDLAIGDEVVVAGKLKDYNGTPEFDKNNYLVSHSNGSNSGNTNTTGTLDNPLTASQAYDAVAAMEKGVTSEADYYVKGKISSIKFTFSAQYGTATFNISDDGATGGKEFIAYSCYYFGNQPWVEGNTQVQVGDEVIVCGKVVNYNGNTPEFASKKNYLVKLNSQTAASRRK